MALILSLDSTTSVCSVAIHNDGDLIIQNFNSEPRAAATQLAVMAKNILTETKIEPKKLSAIAVSSGPGSYTGLRIATSTAKGLALALNIPLIAINSLKVLTQQLVKNYSDSIFCPMLDARRMEVYCALINSELEFITDVEAKILTKDSFNDFLEKNRIVFFGDGSQKFCAIVNHPNATFVESIQPEAKDLGYLAEKAYNNNNFEDLESFEPFYLKDFMIKKKS